MFPVGGYSLDTCNGVEWCHRIDAKLLQRAMKKAVRAAGIVKWVAPHTLRHFFVTHLPERGQDIRTIQELLGHKDVVTTMIYTPVMNKGGRSVVSPLNM